MKVITIQSEHFPISVNSLFRNVSGKGRVRTDRYKSWAAASGWDFNGKGSITGPFEVAIILSRKKARANSDLDNYAKAVIDMLVTHKIVEDDHLLQRLTLEYGDCKGFFCEVRQFFIPL